VFDTPDLSALCVAPFVAVIAAAVLYVLASGAGMAIERFALHRPAVSSPRILLLLFPFLVPTLCIASAALQVGARDPAPWFKPRDVDIVGTWILSPDPTDKLPRPTGVLYPARLLTFLEDGMLSAQEIPDMWSYPDFTSLDHVEFISGTGRWRLAQEEGTERLEWVIFTEFELDGGGPPREMRYYFQGHLPPYTLATIDSGARIFHFTRR
jgi:hypothetical protein